MTCIADQRGTAKSTPGVVLGIDQEDLVGNFRQELGADLFRIGLPSPNQRADQRAAMTPWPPAGVEEALRLDDAALHLRPGELRDALRAVAGIIGEHAQLLERMAVQREDRGRGSQRRCPGLWLCVKLCRLIVWCCCLG